MTKLINSKEQEKEVVLHHYGNALVLYRHSCLKKCLLEAKYHHMNTSYIPKWKKSNEAGINEVHLVFDKLGCQPFSHKCLKGLKGTQ